MIKIKCPNCDEDISVSPKAYVIHRLKCTHCMKQYRIHVTCIQSFIAAISIFIFIYNDWWFWIGLILVATMDLLEYFLLEYFLKCDFLELREKIVK